MKKETSIKAAATVLTLAGILHLVRIIAGWDLVINKVIVPITVSAIAIFVTFGLAYQLCKK